MLFFSSGVFAEEICVEKREAVGALTAEGFEAFRANPEYIELRPEEAAKGRGLLKSKDIGSQPLPLKGEAGRLLPTGADRREAAIEHKGECKGSGFSLPDEADRGKKPSAKSLFERYLPSPEPLEVSTSLSPFGYEIFKANQAVILQDAPVASDYVIGPGDEMNVLVWGRMNGQYALTVSREGTVQMPDIGPVQVGGLTFAEMKKALSSRIRGAIGTEASITMGKFRSIQVFVLGEVEKPGAYVVNGMSTLTGALMLAGGPSAIGSLRNIELKRGGRPMSSTDLYDLLLKGDNSMDTRLQSGDIIFVPPVGPLVGVAGNVKRPAVYELARSLDLAGVIELAGGAMPTAFTQRVQVERIEGNKKRTVTDINAEDRGAAGDFMLQDGDLVKVFAITEKDANAVFVRGKVKRPGKYELKDGMRLSDILRGEGDVDEEAHLDYGLIKRLEPPEMKAELLPFSLASVFSGKDDPLLKPRDTVFVFSRWFFSERPRVRLVGEVRCSSDFVLESRDRKGKRMERREAEEKPAPFEPGKDEKPRQKPDKQGDFKKELKKEGAVRKDEDRPGLKEIGAERETPARDAKEIRQNGQDQSEEAGYEDKGSPFYKSCELEYRENLTVRDLVLLTGGLAPEASSGGFEVYRTDPETRAMESMKLNLSKAMAADAGHNLRLRPDDRVVIHSVRESSPRRFVSIRGEVGKPGEYEYASNWTVKDLVFAAGGVLESAYLKEAEFASGVVEDGRYGIRHMTIDIDSALAGDPEHNLPLSPNDSIHVKRIPEWRGEMYVSLKGEVAFPGRYIIRKGEALSSVIRRAGGFSDSAYLKGAVFTRESVRKLQQKNIDDAIDRFEQKILSRSADSAMSALGADEARQIQSAKEQKIALVEKLRAAKATGRISIRLEGLESFEGSVYDIALEDGDELLVPSRSDQVQVMGAVFNQTAFVHEPNATVSSYLGKSGGMTSDADRKAIYILKVDGTARSGSGWGLRWDSSRGSWLSGGLMSERLDPGDTIVVPEKVDKIAWLKETKDLTQILYQIAVTAGVLMVMF